MNWWTLALEILGGGLDLGYVSLGAILDSFYFADCRAFNVLLQIVEAIFEVEDVAGDQIFPVI